MGMRKRPSWRAGGLGRGWLPAGVTCGGLLVAGRLMLGPGTAGGEVLLFQGACDASAVEALDGEHMVVASDEDNVLRIYRRSLGGPAVWEVDLTAFLRVDGQEPESDLEAAARMGDRIYWITSHGANRRGKERSSRRRFFATVVTGDRADPLRPVGLPYERLLEDLQRVPELAGYRLGEASRRAPKSAGGLNIEGLAGTGEGRLLIGFRSPVPGGLALVVPLENPAEVVEEGEIER